MKVMASIEALSRAPVQVPAGPASHGVSHHTRVPMRRLLFALFALAAAPVTAAAQGLLVPRCAEIRCRPGTPCRPCAPQGGVARVRSDVRVELASGVLRYEVSETFVNNGGAQIGRASCRERVEIAVVGGGVEKKTVVSEV